MPSIRDTSSFFHHQSHFALSMFFTLSLFLSLFLLCICIFTPISKTHIDQYIYICIIRIYVPLLFLFLPLFYLSTYLICLSFSFSLFLSIYLSLSIYLYESESVLYLYCLTIRIGLKVLSVYFLTDIFFLSRIYNMYISFCTLFPFSCFFY